MTALWSWRYDDTTLPPAEHYRVHTWLWTHGLDHRRAVEAHVVAGHGWCDIEVTLTVALPDGTYGASRQRVAMVSPPPVPWTTTLSAVA